MVPLVRKNSIVMLKISGETVQTPGICALLTQSIHTLYLTHTKSEIYSNFLGPVNNDPPPPTTAHIVVVLNRPLLVLRTYEEEVKTKLLVQNLQRAGTTLTFYISVVTLYTNKFSIQ